MTPELYHNILAMIVELIDPLPALGLEDISLLDVVSSNSAHRIVIAHDLEKVVLVTLELLTSSTTTVTRSYVEGMADSHLGIARKGGDFKSAFLKVVPMR